MIENEDVDDDYFTPIAKTSLAKIFKKPISEEQTENETLKYTPLSPKSTQNQDEPKSKKACESIFSCVFDAYLWLDNVYTHKGKLGCAVVKLTTDGPTSFNSILLYDSKKATVSTTVVSKELEVTVKGKGFISYYDSYQKYWSLYGSEKDIREVVDILKTCNVVIKVLKESDNLPPEKTKHLTEIVNPNMTQFESEEKEGKIETTDDKVINTFKKNVESDTDSSINRKTKASILNRMANMGQSVLPPHTVSHEVSSYSSDSNESDNHTAFRHKPTIAKKNVTEKSMFQEQKNNIHKKVVGSRVQHSITAPVVEDKLMPLQSSTIITSSSGTDLSFFITEQRIANSEIRINMTRMTDKVDHILNKLDNIDMREKKEGSAIINTEILHKLLAEYEGKIKTYEKLLQRNQDVKSSSTPDFVEKKEELIINKEMIALRNQISELDKCLKQKDDDIYVLNSEIEGLKASNNSLSKDDFLTKLTELQQEISVKDELLLKSTAQNELLIKSTAQNDELFKKSLDDQLESKLKIIMNDTFRAAAANFETTESYTGEEIHNILAAVIKKVTIESFNKS